MTRYYAFTVLSVKGCAAQRMSRVRGITREFCVLVVGPRGTRLFLRVYAVLSVPTNSVRNRREILYALFLIENNTVGVFESHVLWLPSVSNAHRPFFNFLVAPFDRVSLWVIYRSCPALDSTPLDCVAHVVCYELGAVLFPVLP